MMHVDTDPNTQVRNLNRFLFNLFSPFQIPILEFILVISIPILG